MKFVEIIWIMIFIVHTKNKHSICKVTLAISCFL